MNKEKQKVKIIIFGASKGAQRVFETLTNIGIMVDSFADNDHRKWGNNFCGRKIRNPEELLFLSDEYCIVLASTYHKEITAQLIEMGIKKEIIVPKEYFLRIQLEKMATDEIIGGKDTFEDKNRVIVDFTEGFLISGVVKWALNAVEGLNKQDVPVTLFCAEDENGNCDMLHYPKQTEFFPIDFLHYMDSVILIAKRMEQMLPCTIIINQVMQVFMAAFLVKQKYGENIHIISIVHSDFARIYEQNKFFEDVIDCFFCVSREIKNKLSIQYNVLEDKIFYKQTPVPFELDFKKEYSKAGDPLRLAYAARLEKAQKRTDLLIPLLQELEKKEVNYQLIVAGDGSFYETLETFVCESGLQKKVILKGSIPFEKMNDFWKHKDVFLNVSDIEGAAVSMLEAMSFGNVPIVTMTSGVMGVVEDEKNGFICKTGDVIAIAEKIDKLEKNRYYLKEYGEQCREKIQHAADLEQYMNYLLACGRR